METRPVLSSHPVLSSFSGQRILFLQHRSIRDGYGGVEYYLHDLASMARELFGYERVKVLTLADSPRDAAIPTSFIDYDTMRVSRPQSFLLRKLHNRIPWRLYQKANPVIESFQPTLLVNSHVSLGPLVYAMAKKYHIPYMTCVYGIDVWGNGFPQDEFSLRRARKIISISHWTKQQLLKRGYPASQIEILPPRLPEALEGARPKSHLGTGTFTLLSVSRLASDEAYKGQDHVLKALAILREEGRLGVLKYVIQGDGDDLPRLKLMAKSLNLESYVEFRPPVAERAELAQSYQQADVFILPSQFGKWGGRWRGEGFGIVFVEAGAFGLPSIAYNCGGVTDIIESEEDGILIPPDNLVALANSIARLRDQPALRQRLGQKAHQNMKQKFGRIAFRMATEKTFGITERETPSETVNEKTATAL